MLANALELISHPLCPYVQRASIVLAEKGAPFKRTSIDLAARPDWFNAVSPMGKVPLLKVDQQVLFESAAICDYLDETIGPRLHPQDALQRARHRGWIEFASATLNAIGALYNAPDAGSFEDRRVALHGQFVQVGQALGDGPYFSGPAFAVVDAAFAPVFRYLEVFDQMTDLRLLAGLHKVQQWRAALARRPSVQGAVAHDYPQLLKAFLAARPSHLGALARTA
jgi:glutathione S-transferase